jgi:hypothetical protein
MTFRKALALVSTALNLPFGYTLTTWSAAALATYRFGMPHPMDVFAFIIGGTGAYLTAAALTVRLLRAVNPVRMRKGTLFNLGAIIAAGVVVVAIQFESRPLLGFLTAGYLGILTYIFSRATALWLTA